LFNRFRYQDVIIVNFNTVSFKRVNNEWLSAEPQTPLLPVVIPKIEASGLLSGRITMAYDNDEGMMYAGELFRYFFEQEGISVNGGIKFNRVIYEKNKPLYNYINESSLSSLIRDLLEYSNNFIANQILLTMGAMKFGAPATLDKGVRTLKEYCEQQLGLKAVHIEEGSGLSRGNRITAREMLTVLEHFRKYSHLMRHKGRQYYKTGTLKGVSSRAGYLDSRSAGQYRFVVIRNTNGKTTHEIMKVIEQYLP
jgi:D-alanyl-D-alanine carboxypeptidase/D-alanyl-D-alanine-endopeptidase (penicillin-binding protein 4)